MGSPGPDDSSDWPVDDAPTVPSGGHRGLMDDYITFSKVHNQAQLMELWRRLMGPLGFGRRTLWLVFIEPTGQVTRLIMPIDDIATEPDDETITNLFWLCERVIDNEFEPGTTVAFLLSRAGRARVGDGDLAWARALLAGGRKAALPCWPIHLATDDDLRVISPDDLADSA